MPKHPLSNEGGATPPPAKTLTLDPSGITHVNEPITSNISVYGMVVNMGSQVLANDQWYYCTKCLAAGDRIHSRLSIMAKFCGQCGTELDWERV